MEVLNINSTILSLIQDKNQNIQESYFRRDAIVLSLFRFLSQIEQTIILKNISHDEENLFLSAKKEKSALANLRSFGILQKKDNLYFLNPIFRKTLIQALSLSRQCIFKKINIGMNIEEPDSFKTHEKWISLYSFILKNVGCNINNEKINPEIKKIIEKEHLIVKLEEYEENLEKTQTVRRSHGFSFLVQPIHTQINKFLLFYIQYLIIENANKKSDDYKSFDCELLNLFCQFNLMGKNQTFVPVFENIKLPKSFCVKILNNLDSLGLILYNELRNEILITDLMIDFLNPKKVLSDNYKSHLIVENDFKLYAYSNMNYLVYLLG